MITLLKSRRLVHGSADLAYNARDFMARGDGSRDVCITLKKLVHKEHVATAHAAGLDINENFIGLNIRNRHVLKDEGFVIFVYACCFHCFHGLSLCVFWLMDLFSNVLACLPSGLVMVDSQPS